MAIAVDGSSPVRWNALPGRTQGYTSAAFTAPANALLVCCASHDGDATAGTLTASDTGGLTWTERVSRTWDETTGGGASFIFTARTTSSVSRTVTLTRGNNGENTTRRGSAKLYVLTGVDVDGTPVDTVGATNEGGSATNNLTTTALTPGGTGLLLCCDTDWNASGIMTSTDLTVDTATYTGEISVCSGYKVCTSGVSVTGNLDAGGSANCQHKWCQIVVREAGGGGGTTSPQEGITVVRQAVPRAAYV